ncbi:MAG: glycine cleavage system aminomethyltransferase GcvT [Pseudomonadota bacterium]|jgi:aminomethyltransferase
MNEFSPEPEILTDLEPEALPLDAWHRAKGARIEPFAGYLIPLQYDGVIAEHLWTRDSAGLFDMSHMGQLILSGDGLDAALEALITADLGALAEGQQRYALLLNEVGGILDDLMVARAPMGLFIVFNGAMKWDDIGHLREYLPDEITISHLEDRAMLALQGPKAVDALNRIVPGVETLSFMEAGSFFWGLEPLWISRSGYTGEDGFEISIPSAHVIEFAELLCRQPEVKPIGLGARNSLRLEAGLPLYGQDLDEETDPVEADLMFTLSKRRRAAKDFPGAPAILAKYEAGAARRRVGLLAEVPLSVPEGAPIFAGDKEVGHVTSSGFAPSVNASIAMGYVVAAHSAPDTRLEAEVGGKRMALTVAAMPFVQHRSRRKSELV